MSSVFNQSCGPCDVLVPGDYLLSPRAKSHMSPIFDLDSGCALLRAFNLLPGQKIVLEMVTGTGAGQIVGPVVVSGIVQGLDADNTILHLNQIGRYRVVAVNSDGTPVDAGESMPTVELLRDGK